MEKNQNLQNQLYQLRILREQYDMYQGQLEIINASLGNYLNTKYTLQNLKDGVKKDDEIIIPIGGIVGVKASIQDTEKFLLFIGKDTVIEKNIDESIEFIEKRIQQHNEQIKSLSQIIQKLDLTIQGMSQSIQNSYSERTN
ncbi:MAG: prefoldin subunit alpha [Candidatus Hermodarchaeota archaeon]